MNLYEELKWRGLVASTSGDLVNLLKEKTTFYVGTDPTGNSLHVGHLLAFIVARLLQTHGHKPIILVGGATASLGDPSFKAEERKLLSMDEIMANAECIKKQLSHLIDFNSSAENAAIMVNNYDWMKDFSFLDFAREVGKLITVNYMIAKESVQKRLSREGSGLSFTEFTYQLLQGFDFQQLNEKYGCKLQIGGSDQYGNALTGLEITRKKSGVDNCCVLTWPLVTRADGTKFGKSEGGKNVWLDPTMTSPYEFYQFWLNQTDEDSEKYIKMFTLLSVEEIETLIEEHRANPSARILQKRLAKEVTIMVHSEEDYNIAVATSEVLFGNPSKETLSSYDENTFKKVFDGVPTFEVDKNDFAREAKFVDVAVNCGAFKSKGELRKLIQSRAISINKAKVTDNNCLVKDTDLIHGKYMTIQKGKKVNILVIAK